MQISQFFLKGLNKTLKLINGTNFSYAGPWTTVYTTGTVIDTWFIGDFMTADYTISVDNGSASKEIIKCLVAASSQTAVVTIYGRTNLAGNLINITATVNNSKVTLIARSITGKCKVVHSANYYQTLSTPVPAISSIIPIIPTYSISPNISTAIEGDTIVYTITTTDVDDNTTVYWINSGTTSSADFTDAQDNGTVNIFNNVGTISRTLSNDSNTEGDESVVIEIRSGSITGALLAVSTPTIITDTSIDTTSPVYSVSPSTLTANEGTIVTFTVSTLNVADGTTLYWTNSGTTNGATDFAYPGSNNGTFVVTGNVGTVDITLLNDLTTEGPETIVFKVRTNSVTGLVVAQSFTVTVIDSSVVLTKTYVATPNLNSILEGNSVTYTITTTNVSNGTTLYWTNSGTTISTDFDDLSNTGSFTIINNTGLVTRTLRNDGLTEGSETIILEIRTTSVSGLIVATADNVNIIDSSTGSVIYAYAISPSASFVNEGATITYTINTSNVADGTNLYWTNSGTTVDVDFTDDSNNGFVGINSGSGIISRTLKNDLLDEGSETVILQLRTDSITGSVVAIASTVTINDSSTAPSATYSVVPATGTVNEGSTLAFTVGGTNIINGTYYWTVTNAGDFGTASGNFTITSNSGSFTVTPTADATTEGAETFTVSVRTGSVGGTIVSTSSAVTINDTSTTSATTYSVVSVTNAVDEGSPLTFNVTTTGVADATTLYWTVTNPGDFGTSTGNFTITSNSGSFTVTPTADATTEGSETFTASIRTGSGGGTIVSTSSAVTINDTSTTPSAVYAFNTVPTSVNEGSIGTFDVATTNVANGTILYWTIATNDGDFGTKSGSFSITSNSGSFTVTPTADATTEGSETFTVAVRTGSISGTVVLTSSTITINDTSLAFNPTYTINVGAVGSSAYALSGTDRNGGVSGNNAALAFKTGDMISFVVNAAGHPFWLKTSPMTGTGNAISSGVVNNGIQSGTVQWTVGSTGTFYYICQYHGSMVGTITVT